MGYPKKIMGALAGSVFAVSSAQAEDAPVKLHSTSLYPVSMAQHKSLAAAEYAMMERDKNLGNLTITKVIADAAVGVLCEWRENGQEYLDAQNNLRIANPVRTISGCVPMDEIPSRWNGDQRGMSVSETSGVTGLFRHDKKPDQYLEVSIPLADASGRSLTIMHDWNISAKEVCLVTSEKQDGNMVFHKEWGCFPVRNHGYFEQMVRSVGISPEL
ncbi:MAG: hypothetical protein DI626_02530 [Micavibrio aeruginosavorus]|uniref:DUF3617 domain-containing protein n=1 Tax=Micavibrio aeruginosavorus TaxID=349221 RepID=A0A2W5A3G5_9BACT|nr:MAG: hypothetical protein DI626_02530 [Micavibrio aeruginosavorus]